MVSMKFRAETQDEFTMFEVVGMNSYRLPDVISGERLIIDVGANIGAFTLACAARGGRYFACVEPQPESVELLEDNIFLAKRRFPGLVANTYQAAVSGEAGKATLSYSHSPKHTAMWTLFDVHQGPTVYTFKLDTFLGLSDDIEILKLDCEGGEWPGLLQSEKLRHCRTILAELHLGIKYPGLDCRVETVAKRLKSLGFKVETWTNGEKPDAKLNVMLRATRR